MKRQSPAWSHDMAGYRAFYNAHPHNFDTFEEYHRHYWRKPIKDYNEVPRYAAFLPWLKGGDILDVGCDGGALDNYLYRQGHHVVGLDITEEYITLNRERMPEIEWVLAAFEETEYCEEFDTLICSEVLEHVMDVETFLQRAQECLRPGGVFIGTVPVAGSVNEPGSWYEEDEHLNSFTLSEAHEILSGYFDEVETKLVCGDVWVAFKGVKA